MALQLIPCILGAVFSALIGIILKEWLRPRVLPGPWELPYLVEFLSLFRNYKVIFPILRKLVEDNGSQFEVKRFGKNYVLLSEPETVEAVLSSSVHIKKGDKEYSFFKPWLKEGLLTSDGQKWKTRRKLLTPTFHFKILEDGMNSFAKKAESLTEKLLSNSGTPIVVDDLIRSSTLSIILETAMGISKSNEGHNFNEYIAAVKRVINSIMKRYFKFWKHVDLFYRMSKEGRTFYKDIGILQTFTKMIIKTRKQHYINNEEETDVNKEKNRRKPFLDYLIQLNISNPELLREEDICEEVDTFMFEGHDTTASALTHALFLLANHPDEQGKVAEEQKKIFGDDNRQPTMQDLNKMEYLDMVIKETLRLYPSVPIVTRTLKDDFVLDENTVIPAGHVIVILIYFVHRSKKHWDEPEEFRPERFTPGVSRHPFSFIAFSAGPRNCIGQKFAMMEMKTVLSTILRKCKLEPVTRSIEVIPTSVLKSEPSVEVLIKPRK